MDCIIADRKTDFFQQRKLARIHRKMLAENRRENSWTQWKVYEWAERFKPGKTSVTMMMHITMWWLQVVI